MTLGNLFSLLSESGILNSGQKPQSGGEGGGDLLSTLLGGGQQAQPREQNDSGDLLSTLLGGGQQEESGGGNESGDLLSTLLGGGQQAKPSQQNQSADLLGTLLGGGQGSSSASFLQPIIGALAEKIGISPQIAAVVVSFALKYLLSNNKKQISRSEDLSIILKQKSKSSQTTKISAQLAKETGLDKKTATKAMNEVLKLLGE